MSVAGPVASPATRNGRARPWRRLGLPRDWKDSLRARLAITAGLLVALFLASTGLVLDGAFRSSVERGAAEQLRLHAVALIGAAAWTDGQISFPDGTPDERYDQPGSGLYALVRDRNGRVMWSSHSLIDAELETNWDPPDPGVVQFAPLGSDLFRLSYGVIWVDDSGSEAPMAFTVLAAVEPFEEEIDGFRTRLFWGLGLLAVVLTVTVLSLLGWSLRDFGRLEREVAAVESGRSGRLSEDYPREIRPLVGHLNSFIEHERRSRERYRNALDDLAHALKTPLTALRSGIESGDDKAMMAAQLTRMEEVIGHQLARALPASSPLGAARAEVHGVVERLAAALGKVYRDAGIAIDNHVGRAVLARCDERDLMEVLGNLMDNACKHGNGRVDVGAAHTEDGVRIDVSDDGPGIDSKSFASIARRGRRGDTAAPGQGIGLAIAADIVARYGGRLEVGRASLGGARVSVFIPGSGEAKRPP